MKNYRFKFDAILVRDELWDFEIHKSTKSSKKVLNKKNNIELNICDFYSRSKIKDLTISINDLTCPINNFK